MPKHYNNKKPKKPKNTTKKVNKMKGKNKKK